MVYPPLLVLLILPHHVVKENIREVLSLKIYIVDFIDPTVNQLDSFVVEADGEKEAQEEAIKELKTLGIPKRYLLKIEEVL